MIEALIFVVFPFCMAYAAISDMMSMTIANRVSVLMIAVFLVVAPFAGMGLGDIGWHLAAGALMLAVTFGLFAMGGMGGGDAKLMTATAVWLGYELVLVEYLVMSAIFGGVLTLLILLYRKSPLAPVTGAYPVLRHLADQKEGIPYGVALGLGGLAVFPKSPLALWAVQSLAAG